MTISNQTDLIIEPRFLGRNGMAAVTVRLKGEMIHHDKLDLGRTKSREQFLDDLTKNRPGIIREEASRILLKLASDRAASGDSDDEKLNLTEMLVDLTTESELFHDSNQAAFATVPVGNHFETWSVKSKGFRLWLRRRLQEEYNRSAYSEALQTAIEDIESTALFAGPQTAVHVRVAESDGSIWLDLGNESWEAVQITSRGWSIFAGRPPVKFIRPRGMLPLPTPQRGGTINDLRPFLNVATDTDFVLMVSWLVAAFRARGPYPILNVCGEQGSAKSTSQRILRNLIDPNTSPLRCEPREPRDLMISASNSWVLAFDNVSRIPPWLSDAFCRLSTGGGFATRELFTNGEECIFEAQRPLMFNGIEDVATRSDLLDRTLTILLAQIADARRKDEKSFWREFEAARPRILGALLDAVVAGLAKEPTVRLKRMPRMADFALWITACEVGLGWAPSTFLNAYTSNRETANESAIEASIIGPVVLSFMATREFWQGTATELLGELEKIADERTRTRQGWPSASNTLSGKLTRIAPNLRAQGIEVTRPPRSDKKGSKFIRLEKTGNRSSESQEPPEQSNSLGNPSGGVLTVPEPLAVSKQQASAENTLIPRPSGCSDGSDDEELPLSENAVPKAGSRNCPSPEPGAAFSPQSAEK